MSLVIATDVTGEWFAIQAIEETTINGAEPSATSATFR